MRKSSPQFFYAEFCIVQKPVCSMVQHHNTDYKKWPVQNYQLETSITKLWSTISNSTHTHKLT